MPLRHCHLVANLHLRPDLDDDKKTAVSTALSLCPAGLASARGDVLWGRDGYLHIHLSFEGEGGPDNAAVQELAEALSPFVSLPGYLEIIDFDSPHRDRVRFPYFVGADEAAREKARSEHSEAWKSELVGKLKALKAEGLTLEDCAGVFAKGA